MIEWKPSLSVGIPEIDAQHRELFRRAALFVDGIGHGSRADTASRLEYLRVHALDHCRAEEAWMAASGFAGAAAHARQHEQFLRELGALEALHRRPAGPGLQAARVDRWLRHLLVSHVSRSDLELALHLRARRGAAAGQGLAG